MKVRITIAVFILCFSLIGCTSSHSIYYTNTKAVKKEIESINGCGDLLEQVKHNFFLNKKDSVYFENFGFFAHGIGADYHECLKQLDRAQIISIFGIPHFEKDSTLYYVARKQNSISQHVQCYIFKPRNVIPFNLQYIWIDEEYTTSDINNLLEIASLKKANFIKRSNTYSAIENKDLRANCLEEKTFLNDKVYYNKKKKHHLLDFFFAYKMSSMDYEIPCLESFQMKEILDLFGEAPYTSSDTIIYPIYDRVFDTDIKRLSDAGSNGKVLCVYFNPITEKYYKYNYGAFDLNRLEKK